MYAVSEMVNIHFIVTCRAYCLIIVFLYIILLTLNDLYLVYIFKSYFSIFYLFFFPKLIYILHFEPLIESQKQIVYSINITNTPETLAPPPASKIHGSDSASKSFKSRSVSRCIIHAAC